MISTGLVNIQRTQDKYFERIEEYQKAFSNSDLSVKTITMILDEIKYFWLEQFEIVEFELGELAEHYTCFLLSGAVYLNVSEKEHYYFKSLGDFHLISDPFLKMEPFFRLERATFNPEDQINYLKDIYNDTIQILKNYKQLFYIVPINEISSRGIEDRDDLLETFFLRFLSSLFARDFGNRDLFCDSYRTYEEIADNLDEEKLKYLIFTDYYDLNLSLRERIERYFEMQIGFSDIFKDMTEAQTFLLVLNSYISQASDILLTCTYLRVNPFIRNEITFNYLTLIMHTFVEDKYLKSMIEKTLVFYILYKSIDRERFKDLDFSEYCRRLQKKPLLEKTLREMHSQGIDVIEGGIDKVKILILKAFEDVALSLPR